MSKRRILGLLALTALLIGALTTRRFGLSERSDRTLKLYGNDDIRQMEFGFRVPGQIASMAFDEGAKVSSGAVLARLDTGPLLDIVAAGQAQIEAASAELSKRRNGNRAQDVAEASAQLAERRAALTQARDSNFVVT